MSARHSAIACRISLLCLALNFSKSGPLKRAQPKRVRSLQLLMIFLLVPISPSQGSFGTSPAAAYSDLYTGTNIAARASVDANSTIVDIHHHFRSRLHHQLDLGFGIAHFKHDAAAAY